MQQPSSRFRSRCAARACSRTRSVLYLVGSRSCRIGSAGAKLAHHRRAAPGTSFTLTLANRTDSQLQQPKSWPLPSCG